jgi:putative aminopeptidase FrvX
MIDHTLLHELLAVPSPTGFEEQGQRTWARYVSRFADGIENDAYGNAWATLRGATGAEHRVMIAAHADEIGFMISHITDEGFLYFTRIGGSDPAIARGRRVAIMGAKGVVNGVIGITAIHLRDTKDEKVPEWHEMFIDVGATSREEVEKLGLRVGHPAIFDEQELQINDRRLVARAIDNRVGGYIVARVMERLASETSRNATFLGVNAVQEEIGGNGARMVTYRLEPSVAIVIDVTHATDSPGISKEKHGKVELGGGPTVSHGTANHPLVVRRLIDVAEDLRIPLQHEATSRFTGTDTDDVFVSKRGVPSALVSIPLRYMHSPAEMVDLKDVEHAIDLIEGFALSISDADTFIPQIAPI